MIQNSLLDQLKDAGRLSSERANIWRDAIELLAIMDAIGREGPSVVIKIDGGRDNGSCYTVVISGGQLGDEFFHKDGPDLAELLMDAIKFYQGKVGSAGAGSPR